MSRETLLYLHLVGAFLFVGGSVLAAALRIQAIWKRRPSEVALLLGAVRPAVPIVGGGFVLALAMGFWLVDRYDLDLGDTWLSASIGLSAWLLVVGAIAGRLDRHARELAEELARSGDERTPELDRRLRDPIALTLNATMIAAIAAIVALMVWKP